jgi:hypothetical protein
MTEQTPTRCVVCDGKLEGEKERNMQVCCTCRSYGLLYGYWPESSFLPFRTRLVRVH